MPKDAGVIGGSGQRVPQRHGIAFAGGGSGGHLFPAITLAERVLADDRECRIQFFTSMRALDECIVSDFIRQLESVCPAPSVDWSALPAYSGLDLIRRPWRSVSAFMLAFRRAVRMLRQNQIRILVASGGYASVAPALAARSLKIPVVLLEPNRIPGRANRLLSRIACVTCTGFPLEATGGRHLSGRVINTGVPVRLPFCGRRENSSGEHPDGAIHGSLSTLLILGGSQGSQSVNRLVMEVFERSGGVPGDWHIVHQTGHEQHAEVSDFYRRLGRCAEVHGFLQNVPQQLSRATLVLCRAGALTLAEISCSGVPAVLIPLSTSANGHQMANARYLAEQGAAIWIDETSADSADSLSRTLRDCSGNPERLRRMKTKLRVLARPDATDQVLSVIDSCLEAPVAAESG